MSSYENLKCVFISLKQKICFWEKAIKKIYFEFAQEVLGYFLYELRDHYDR